MLGKITYKTSETRESLDKYDIKYMLSIYEYVELQDYLEAKVQEDANIKRNNATNNTSPPMGFGL